ncbi:MAG: sulfatase-like hydrolase/transferase [Candidatus Brocadiae bacterium]|nr:sulfatase-like hydrolase/transferase [Candidatus Brocadiia bacterium]
MARPDRPNIVWLLTDHHVFAHHYFLPGPRPVLPTYERLAREGVAFTNAYAVCPLCTPARASMLTGVYPHRHEMVMNNGDCGSRLDFEPDARLFSHYMNDAGYRCGYFGKWHVGDERGPLDYGFEGWSQLGYGHPYWDDDYAAYLDELGLPQATVDVEWHFADPARIGKGIRLKDEPNWHQRMECAGRLTTPVETHEAYYLAHRASQWLECMAKDSDPFCLRVDVWGPHQPYWVAEPFAGTIEPRDIPEYPSFAHDLADRPEQHRRFAKSRREHSVAKTWEDWQPVVARSYEHATQVDAALGRVLDTLDRLGLADNTLVFYTADHGDAIGSHGGVFDKDSLMVEETERIPLAVRWQGRAPAGVQTRRLATHMDLVPTLLDAGGAQMPQPLDGRSLVPLVQHPHDTPWPDDLLCQHHGHGHPCLQRMVRCGPYKYVAHLDDLDELYDLRQDPYELRNCIADPSLADVRKDMQERLRRLTAECDDNAPDVQRLCQQLD